MRTSGWPLRHSFWSRNSLVGREPLRPRLVLAAQLASADQVGEEFFGPPGSFGSLAATARRSPAFLPHLGLLPTPSTDGPASEGSRGRALIRIGPASPGAVGGKSVEARSRYRPKTLAMINARHTTFAKSRFSAAQAAIARWTANYGRKRTTDDVVTN